MNKSYDILFAVSLPPQIHGLTVMSKYIKDSKLINNEFDYDYVNLSISRNIEELHRFMWIKNVFFAKRVSGSSYI